MDYLKPPTDNLYKFIALAGLLTAVVPLVFAYKYEGDQYAIARQRQGELSDIINEYHNKFLMRSLDFEKFDAEPGDPMNSMQFVVITQKTPQQRDDTLEHLKRHDNLLVKLASTPIQGDKKAKQFWIEYLKVPEQEYEIMIRTPISEGRLSRAIEEARQFRVKHQRAFFIVSEIWQIVDDEEIVAYSCIGTSLLGVVATLLGFVTWYYKVQRHQDAMLILERKKLEKESVAITAT